MISHATGYEEFFFLICQTLLGDIVALCIYQLNIYYLLSDKHNFIDLVYLAYLTLLRVSAVRISNHQVWHEYTKSVKKRSVSLQTVGINLL
jgi:hypothetical protein